MYVLAVGLGGDFFGECESIMINMILSGKMVGFHGGIFLGFFVNSGKKTHR